MRRLLLLPLLSLLLLPALVDAQDTPFERMDVFELEWVTDPQISPDGERVVYVRRGMDVMNDRRTSALWIMNADGTEHVKLTDRDVSESSPRWSPDGTRLAYIGGTEDDGAQIFVHTFAPRSNVQRTTLDNRPGHLAWSPSGSHLAFSMHVDDEPPQMVEPPEAPEGADWADPPRVETRLNHEQDGSGIRPYGHRHIFTITADSDSDPEQRTTGDYDHAGPIAWMPDGEALVVSGNRHDDAEHAFRNTELYRVDMEDGAIAPLTDRFGPNHTPRISPDGATIAYLGYEDQIQTYQRTRLYTMSPDGSGMQEVETGLERSINDVVWDEEGNGLYVQYDDEGVSYLAHTTLDGAVTNVADSLGGTALGRPYRGSADFSVAENGVIAFNVSSPAHPAELSITSRSNATPSRLTTLNETLIADRALGQVEAMRYTSTKDGRDLHGWVMTPPDYNPDRAYPLLVEIHGGPISHYGPHFAAELQLYAAAGYVVFYPNARGSTSYGEEFGNLLKNDFSGGEYQDIIDGVDVLVENGTVSEDSLYVTGGSAGGTSTAWIVGQTDRFQAAAVQKPVINWISKTLAADNYYAYADYRYPGQPWENPMAYWEVSPISLVGNVETPTLLIVGQEDLRTPTWEAKQFYHALQLREVDTAYVELPGSYHNMAARPSQLIAKVDHVLAWLERYR
ncbi:MAG: S9 family peptidase [Longimonas sp.]|uniref:S9 family peptidase n=1 Tax=Longimonas sp. TaxID=2039626 RepID=UPI0033496A9A